MPNWKVLNLLWHRGPSTVRDVHEKLTELPDIRYKKMTGKGLAKRDESQTAHLYEAALDRSRWIIG